MPFTAAEQTLANTNRFYGRAQHELQLAFFGGSGPWALTQSATSLLVFRLHLLACSHRTIRIRRTSTSLHFKQLRQYPVSPKTLGEHLRKKRVDMQLSMTQLADQLGLGITDSAIEKWEKNQNRPTTEHRDRIVDFLGFDPATAKLTGDSHR